jgi:hypothetical protein
VTASPAGSNPTLDPAIERAYRSAVYQIQYDEDRTLTRIIGRVDTTADTILRTLGCRQTWSIITPCNPRSIPLDADANQARLQAMRRELDALGWRWLPARNGPAEITDGTSDWVEPGFCILDPEQNAVLALAARYQQFAAVFARLGAAPRLLVVGSDDMKQTKSI